MVMMAVPTLSKSQKLQILRSHQSATGYRHVYQTTNNRFVAKIKETNHRNRYNRCRTIGRASTPAEAALMVADWYEDHYGADWPKVFKARFSNPWKVRYCPQVRLYALDVWVFGVKETVFPGRCGGFKTRQEAKEFFKKWRIEKFGWLFANFALWKPVSDCSNPVPSRERMIA